MEQAELISVEPLPSVDIDAELQSEIDKLMEDDVSLPACEVKEPEPAVQEAPVAKADDLVKRAVFVSIKLRKPGSSKKLDSSKVTFLEGGDVVKENDGVDKKMISVSKKLIDCDEYKAVGQLDTKLKNYISSRCSPSAIREAVFLLAVPLVNEVDRNVKAFKERRKELIAKYGAVYNQRVKEALERLGPEGNANDYPPWEAVEKQYGFDIQYLTFGAPMVLGDVNQEIFNREQARVAVQFQNALDITRQELRAGMAKLVNAFAENLSSEPGEPKKRFYKSLVDKMTDFLSVFDARNLADDKALAELVSKSKQLLEGVEVQELRTDDAVRQEVAAGFEQIKASLSQLVEEEPLRPIVFDD